MDILEKEEEKIKLEDIFPAQPQQQQAQPQLQQFQKPEQPKEKPQEQKPIHLPDTDIENVPRKKSVLLVIILTWITLGIYKGIWYMKKVTEFLNLGTNKKPNNTVPTIFIILNILIIAAIIILPITITQEMGTFYQYLSPLQTGIIAAIVLLAIIKLTLSLFLAFHARTIINQALENKESKTRLSVFFTIIFTHLYLQYEINKIIDDKEDTPKIAPWIMVLVIFIIIALAIIIPSFGLI
jgi:hypothetical protein